jgi:uncharacterized protein HemX
MQVTELTVLNRIILIVLDKLVLAAVLAFVVYYFNKRLQKQRQAHEQFLQNQKSRDERFLQHEKARDELLNANADSRVGAYTKLWGICKQVRFAEDRKITNEDRKITTLS